MKRKNIQICGNCSHHNPLHLLNCEACNFLLHDKIVNINLFSTLSDLIDSPKSTFKTIIQSEHKNYISYLIVLIASKIFITGYIAAAQLELGAGFSPIAYPIAIVLFAVIVLLFSYGITLYNKANNWKVRTIDTFSVLLYSMIPLLFGMLILLPLEFIVFGNRIFDTNPSPFIIKSSFAYIFTVLEAVILLWTIFLTGKAIHITTDSPLLAVSGSIVLVCGLHILAFYGMVIFN